MIWIYCVCVCFFQAEDGIRDLVRSRGLGDVYKRQVCRLRRPQSQRSRRKTMAKEEKKGIGDQAKDAVVDVRNEMIVQSANLYIMVRKVLLSSLGAVALTMDEANELLARMGERGEGAERPLIHI